MTGTSSDIPFIADYKFRDLAITITRRIILYCIIPGKKTIHLEEYDMSREIKGSKEPNCYYSRCNDEQ